jgi:hypothetical protein
MISLANSIRLPRQLDLARLQREFETGNQQALVLAIHFCGQRNLPLAPWIIEAWERGCYDIIDRKVESWDDVLANGKRKTVKQLLHGRIKAQKMWLIRWRAVFYRDIPISNNRQRLKRDGHSLVKAPDRFDAIAQDLTGDGKVHRVWGPCARSEAKALWYEMYPPDRSLQPAKTKHKKQAK